MGTTLRGADVLAQTLARSGARTIFSLSGNHVVPVFDAVIDAKLDIVHVRHEGAATHMADAWGRVTGEPGIALFTGGPGHANGVGPLFTALGAESPLVMLSGHAPLEHVGLDGFQEMRQADMAAPAVKASWTVQQGEHIGTEVARALVLAKSGRPGPVHVSIPSDMFEATFAEGDRLVPASSAFAAPAVGLSDVIAQAVVAEIRKAARPVILTGPWMSNGRGRELRTELQAATGVPVIFMESPRGTADPSLGAVADILAAADLVVLLGKKLDFTLRFGRPPVFSATCRIIQIDPDTEALRRAALAIDDRAKIAFTALADTYAAADALIRAAAPAKMRPSAWAEEVQSLLRYRPAEWKSLASRDGAVHPVEVGRAVQRFIERHADSIYVSDGGEYSQWVQAHVQAKTRMTNGPGGSIGGGIPFCIAAKLARPQAPVICSLGDGSFGYHMAEFETALRSETPFVAIVGNDSCWNAEHQIQLRQYGKARAIGCEMLGGMRYDQAVAAFGAHGECVTQLSELEPAIERAFRSGKPACVNVMVERVAAPLFSTRAGKPGTSDAS